MPRPKFKVTDEHRRMVESLSGLGLTELNIADALNIDPKTLRKYFSRERKAGSVRAYAAVKQTFYQMATSGKNPAATLAWLDQYERRTHDRAADETYSHGSAVPEQVHIELEKRITAELDRVAAAGEAASICRKSEPADENSPGSQMAGLARAA